MENFKPIHRLIFFFSRALQAFETAVSAVFDRCNDKKAVKTDLEYRCYTERVFIYFSLGYKV